MTYTFDAQNPAVDDGEITALEELLDAPLPENYKALLKYSHAVSYTHLTLPTISSG